MSAMSQLAFELQETQDQAWEAAMELDVKLGQIANQLWQDNDGADGPMFRAPDDLVSMLDSIQRSIQTQIDDSKATTTF